MSTAKRTKPGKSAKLSPREQCVYFTLAPGLVGTVSQATQILGDEKAAREAFYRLGKKGFAQRVQHGIYILVPPESLGAEYLVDPLVLASRFLRDGYFLSHHTALELHGVAHTVLSTVYISVNKARPSLTFQGTSYRFIETKYMFGVRKTIRSGQTVKYSDLEKTVIDCVRRPDLAGGLEEILKSFSSLPRLKTSEILSYIKRINQQSLFHRLGFILNMVDRGARIQDELMRSLRNHLSTRVYYLLPRQKGGRLVKEWAVIVPKYVE